MNKVKILFLASDPSDAARLRLGQELRDVREKLQLSKQRDNFFLESRESVRPGDITQAILDTEPSIIHFSGHGTSKGELCFEDALGKTQSVKPDALASLFELVSEQVGCVVLNACYSEVQAKAIAQHIPFVIGMSQAMGDKAAITFSVGFYKALGSGRSIEDAFKFARVEIQLESIPYHLTPILHTKVDTNADLTLEDLQIKPQTPPSELITLNNAGTGITDHEFSANNDSSNTADPSGTEKQTDLPQLWTRKKFLALGLGGIGVIGTAITVKTSGKLEGQYSNLEELLKLRKWQEANEESQKVILTALNQDENQPISISQLVELPCEIFHEIDKLWTRYSSGRFGFSIQERIYLECKFFSDVLTNRINCFGDRLGWRVDEKWISRRSISFDLSAPVGHLPFLFVETAKGDFDWSLLSDSLITDSLLGPVPMLVLMMMRISQDEQYPFFLMSKLSKCQI